MCLRPKEPEAGPATPISPYLLLVQLIRQFGWRLAAGLRVVLADAQLPEVVMVVVKVEYDSSTQQFRLVDSAHAGMFDDGGVYFLAMEIFPSKWDDDAVAFSQADIAHA